MEINIVIEGHEGLTWSRWRRILAMVEQLGFSRLYRSDHFFIGRQQDSLDAFLSFVMAATETQRLVFGSLVTPVTFRTPVDIGRMTSQIDALSGGRFVLGLGAGWNADEHAAYGIPFPGAAERLDRLEEAIRLIRALWAPGPSRFDGRFYELRDADCIPKPSRRIPILLGGVGEKRTLRIVAEQADEWCSECITIDEYAHKVDVLERYCTEIGRDPRSIHRSMVVTGDVVPTRRRIARSTARRVVSVGRARNPHSDSAIGVPGRFLGLMIGGPDQIIDQLGRYAEHGLQEAVFRHFDLDSDAVPEYVAERLVPLARNI